MQVQEFIKKRKALRSKLETFKKQIDRDYTKVANDFIAANSPVKKLKVYELKENGIRRKGFRRFIIYTQDIEVLNNSPMIRVGGWWLNDKNVPTKWDTMTVTGVGNPAKFELSKNQKAERHPESTDK